MPTFNWPIKFTLVEKQLKTIYNFYVLMIVEIVAFYITILILLISVPFISFLSVWCNLYSLSLQYCSPLLIIIKPRHETRLRTRRPNFTFEMTRSHRALYANSYFSQNDRLSKSLLNSSLLAVFCLDLQKYKCNANRHFLSSWIHFVHCVYAYYYTLGDILSHRGFIALHGVKLLITTAVKRRLWKFSVHICRV